MKVIRSLSLAILLVLISKPLLAAEAFIDSSNGVEFFQLNFPENDPVLSNSSVGLLEVNYLQLRLSTGMQSGYINVVAGGVWVVRNLPVFPENDYPYPYMSVRFDLGVPEGNAVTALNADVLYSDDVKQAAVTGSTSSFTVSNLVVSIGGVFTEEELEATEPATAGPGNKTPPTLNDVLFGDPANTTAILQLDHPNLEAALNQCYPMAVANSLQFLEDTTDLVIPHNHVAGLKGDDSLVGQIGAAMERVATSRSSGEGVGSLKGIEGKLKYIAENGLQDRIKTTTMGRWALGKDRSVTANGNTATSTSGGATIKFADVVSALQGGQDCEVTYHWPGGGHAVDLVGAGFTNGQPWMLESSDVIQSSDSKGAGPRGLKYSHLVADKDGVLSLNGGTSKLTQVVCQEYIPVEEPIVIFVPQTDFGEDTLFQIPQDIISVTDPAGHRSFVDDPPGTYNVIVGPGQLQFDGGASWLPLSITTDGSGSMSGSNTATVAGFSNITNTISVTIAEKTMDATITLGANGGLPQGQPIVFNTRITSAERWSWIKATPEPAELTTSIRVNGFRHNFTSSATDPLSIGVSLEPGAQVNTNADWWIVAQSGDVTAYYDLAASNWIIGPLAPSRQGPLTAIPSETVFRAPGSALPAGEYTFYFGVDTEMNGQLDIAALKFDSVVLTLE